MTSNFQYDFLPESSSHLRLLELEAAESIEAPIICTLTTCNYSERPEYEALSYVWGEDEAVHLIRLDGCPFPVRPNLEQALRYLRLVDKNRNLWIDAICINQADNDEKSDQLPLMRDIFAGAIQVVIWLGGPDEAVESAFRYMINDPGGIDPDDPEFVDALPGLLKIFQNRWWKRMWTAQELLVASAPPTLVCGYTQIAWTMLDNMISYLDAISTNSITFAVDMQPIETMSVLRQHWRMQQQDGKENSMDLLTLGNLLISTSDRDAHDPKDQIFALLGIASTDPRTSIPENYKDSISSIYQKAMVEVILSRGNLEFLRLARLLPPAPRGVSVHHHNLPSWCLDFSIKDWNAHRENIPTFSLRTRGWDDRTNKFEGYGYRRGLDIRHFPVQNAIRVLGAKVSTVSASWRFGAEDALRRCSQHSTHLGPGKNTDELSSEPNTHLCPHCLLVILEDFERFETVITKTLSKRVGSERASQLVQRGMSWRILDGGRLQPREIEAWRQLQHAGYQNIKMLAHHELLRLWSKQYSSGGGSEGDKCANLATEDESSKKKHQMEIPSDSAPETSTFSDEVSAVLFAQLRSLAGRADGKTFFSTQSGLVGRTDTSIDEPLVHEFDILCVLQKCTRPVILRPCNDGRYRIISFAYVHDVFEESGTAVQLAGYKEEWFDIC